MICELEHTNTFRGACRHARDSLGMGVARLLVIRDDDYVSAAQGHLRSGSQGIFKSSLTSRASARVLREACRSDGRQLISALAAVAAMGLPLDPTRRFGLPYAFHSRRPHAARAECEQLRHGPHPEHFASRGIVYQ